MMRAVFTMLFSLALSILVALSFSRANPPTGHDWALSFAFIISSWACAWSLSWVADLLSPKGQTRWLVPAIFGIGVIAAWEVYVHASAIPVVLLPSPSEIASKFAGSLPTLAADFVQTILRAVKIGRAHV